MQGNRLEEGPGTTVVGRGGGPGPSYGVAGPLFSAFGVLFVSYSITRRRVVPLARAFAILAAVGFAVFADGGIFVMCCTWARDKPETPTLAQALDKSMEISEQDIARAETGQEFVLSRGASGYRRSDSQT